jgi:hypothetical protein
MGRGTAVLRCESCAFFRTDQTHGLLQVGLVALAAISVAAAAVLAIRSVRRRGVNRAGWALLAVGVLAVPAGFVPLVRENVVTGPDGIRVFCDKPLYSSEVLRDPQPGPPTSTTSLIVAELEGCRSAVRVSYARAAAIWLLAAALGVIGVVLARRHPTPNPVVASGVGS